MAIACRSNVDAIHPGYGLLSENHEFAAKVRAAGIAFIGPESEVIHQLGDKVEARKTAATLGVPCVPGMSLPIDEAAALTAAERFFEQNGTSIFKAAHGGGGRHRARVMHGRRPHGRGG